jgi:hypothetical protein
MLSILQLVSVLASPVANVFQSFDMLTFAYSERKSLKFITKLLLNLLTPAFPKLVGREPICGGPRKVFEI